MKKAITFFISMLHFFAFSQETNFNNFIHFSVPEGLSQSTVISLAQDQLGQMWIGTRDGLNKYDGEEITFYKNNPNDTTSLSNNDILCIKEDSEGLIWVGTHNGLSRFNPKTELFKRILHSSDKNADSHCSIRSIVEISEGVLWIASSNGLYIYNKKNEKLVWYQRNDSNSTSIRSNLILDIFQDSNQNIWIGTSAGLHKVVNDDINALTFKRYDANDIDSPRLSVQTINEDDKGNLLIGTKSNGLYTFNPKTKAFKKPDLHRGDAVKSTDIRKLVYDQNLNLWIGTFDGLYVKKSNDSIIHIVHQPGNPKSLSKNSIKDIFVDRNGSVWIGTYYGGVNLWDIHNNYFYKLYRTKGDQAYHLGVVSTIVEDCQGKLYLGTEGNGITVLHKDGKTDDELTNILSRELSNANIKSMFLDTNNLWIGTLKNGIKCFNINTRKFETSIYSQLRLLLKNNGVYSIKKMGDYLIFGTFGNGIVVFHQKKKELNLIQYDRKNHTSLSNDRVRCMISDHHDNLWIGTDKGLNKISLKRLELGSIRLERYLFNDEKSYGHNILCIYQGHNGQMYVGTRERGILKLENGTFNQLDFKLLNTRITTVYSIVEDDYNTLWISCNLGLVKHELKTKKTTVYNQSEGFLGNEFINNSYLYGSNKNLYFGGVKGVSFFNPRELRKSSYTSRVVLTDIKITGKEPDRSISFKNKIKLAHDEASFLLSFAVPNYINTSENRYGYRLLGLNDEWKFTNNHEVGYTIQKPGKYTFQVKDANNQEAWGDKPTVLEIEVKAALWKTPWAYALYFLIIAFSLYQIYRNMRSKIELRHKLQSERLENSRQEEINKSKLEFFTNISHDFRTPLTLILAPIQQLIENYSGTKETYKKLLTIERNADQLLKLTNQVLDFRAYENKHSKLRAREGDIVVFLEGIYRSFQEYASIGNYTYSYEHEAKNIQLFYDQNKLEKVFFNVISNAFKYTPKGGEVKVKLYRDHNQVVIEISDNGRGISKAFINNIFDRYYGVANDTAYQKQFNQGSGIGLHIAKKAIELHKGTIEVESEESVGTLFRISLKTGHEHLEPGELLKGTAITIENRNGNQQNYLLETFSASEINKMIVNRGRDAYKILVVEDNEEFRSYVVSILKDYYVVDQAVNGEEGFKKALRILPDLIISDVIMPKMEGTALCSKIKNDTRTSHIPVILLTTRSSVSHKFEGLESGADAYIDKPFKIKELLLTIKNLLNVTERFKHKFNGIDLQDKNNTIDSVDENLQRKAIKIVENNIDNSSFSIPTFSSELGLSRTMLFVKIKEWTNLTPKEFINSIRMKKASELLELGELSISEVGYKVGFKDPKYFSKSFKKHFQKTPSEYAEKFYS
ncbi:response regulator [Aquimarina sp. U1-2]|uniref:hybrid sensor histidine kinase/response regulator transcription factor n=1 Tax=Aquimarina sp. U1-2 TaxID=2823141 RepID=UPI001AEC7E14|nr:two-component regulator propeller domain-containing protein [Aquimarina sp. U1-2]MBP2833223.1 response regulator [Aquimarina sp. U1-2]